MKHLKNALFASAVILSAQPALAQDQEQARPAPERGVAWHSQQQLFLLNLKAEDGWYFAEGGIRWKYLAYTAAQDKPSVADTVTVHYEGRLIDGTVFDSSYQRGEPATFPLSRLIKGWQIAIPQIGVGEAIEVAIPAEFAYGPSGSGPIPGGATLVFKIELLGIDN